MQIFKTMEKSEFHVLIKHCFLMGKNTVQAKQWLDKCYLDSIPLEITVKRWYADFRCDCTDTNDAVRSGYPNLAVVPKTSTNTYWSIINWSCVRFAEELKISESSVFIILDEHFSMRKLCSKWVQWLLTVDQKQQSVDNSEHFLQLFQCNKKQFLYKYETMDETWTYHFVLESN